MNYPLEVYILKGNDGERRSPYRVASLAIRRDCEFIQIGLGIGPMRRDDRQREFRNFIADQVEDILNLDYLRK